MIVLATGGRGFCEIRNGADHMNERRVLGLAMDFLNPSSVIVGDASGADRWVKIWCRRRGVPYEEFTAEWGKLGKSAGPARNQRMIDRSPNQVIRFPGGRGTADCVKRAVEAGIDVYEVRV